MTDNDIIVKFWNKKHPSLVRYLRGHENIDEYIIYLKNRFSDCVDIHEALYRIKYNIEERPKCPICGKIIQYNDKLHCFNQFCSRTCANKNPKLIEHRQATILKKYGVTAVAKLDSVKQKMLDAWKNKSQDELDNIRNKQIKTNLKKYGVEWTLQSKEVKDKIKQTNLERYGFEYPTQSKEIKYKVKQTNIERYGVENPAQSKEIKDKIKQTNIERYGVICTLHAKEIKDKVKQTNLDRYGFEYPTQSKEIKDKTKQTNLERYGFENPAQSKEVKDKIKQTTLERFGVECVFYLEEYRDKEKHISPEARRKAVNTIFERYGKDNYANREKVKQTCLERYGETHHFKTEYYKKLLSDIISSEEIRKKVHETKKNNGSYGKSKEEDYLYTILVDMYGKDNVERQYKSELYPFACDFYIISEDLYIEYNGIWTHGFTPYIGSKENEVQLDKWKQKAITSKFYQNAIITWTISDVKKRNIAKENNLNYIELWNISDINNHFKI